MAYKLSYTTNMSNHIGNSHLFIYLRIKVVNINMIRYLLVQIKYQYEITIKKT